MSITSNNPNIGITPSDEIKALDPHPFLDKIWETLIPEGFKPPSLAKFDGHKDPYGHVGFINTQMAIIGVPGSLKYKLFSNTFRDATLKWYMSYPKLPSPSIKR